MSETHSITCGGGAQAKPKSTRTRSDRTREFYPRAKTAHQVSGWIPAYTIGFTVRQTMILEFAPTIIPVILSGKVGSNIASQIGTMQVTEQISLLIAGAGAVAGAVGGGLWALNELQ